VLTYWNKRIEHKAERYEAIDRHVANCKATKKRPNVFFSIPVD